jgi:hypothetical protein
MYTPEDSVEAVTMIAFILIFLGLIFLIIMRFLKKSKGDVKIELPTSKDYQLSDKIKGKVAFRADKKYPVSAIKITLDGKCYNDTDQGFNTNKDEDDFQLSTFRTIHKETLVLIKNITAQKGKTEMYDFEFTLPSQIEISPATQLYNKIVFANYEWNLIATVEVEGVDLSDRKQIKVLFDGD